MKKSRIILCALFVVILGVMWLWLRNQHSVGGRDKAPAKMDVSAVPSQAERNASPAAPPTQSSADMATVEAEGARLRLEKLRDIAQKSNMAIEFFGLILDQNDTPIPGVKVTMSVRTARELSPGVFSDIFEHPILTTGEDGRFALRGAKGALLSLRALEKPGYQSSEKSINRAHYWYWRAPSLIFHPDETRPEVFRMWKQAGAERLVRKGIGHAIPYNGSGTNFDLINGKAVAGAGDMRVTLVRNPQQIQWGQKNYEWTATIEVPNGGVIESSDEQMYRAPADGYQPKCVIHMAADDANWTDSKDIAIYLKLRGGQYYGRAELKFMVGSDRAVTPFSITSFINPNGSQNLEYDPMQDVVPSARLQSTAAPGKP